MVERSRRHKAFLHRYSALYAFAVLALGAACQTKPDAGIADTPQGRSPDTSAATASLGVAALAADFCLRQGWTTPCRVHEYPDDQRLNDGNDQYGPEVKTYPALNLGTRSHQADFQGVGAPVAAIMVDTGTLPPTYTRLNLVTGMNCLYLRYFPGPNQQFGQYDGYVFRAETNGTPCPDRVSGNAQPLRVRAVKSKAFPAHTDVPAVFRFREGHIAGEPQPLFGIKCADRWCILGPSQADTNTVAHHGKNQGKRSWAVHGWSDAQRLAVMNSATGQLQYGPEASIIAGPGAALVGLAKFDTLVHAATVWFRGNPGQTEYKTKWGFNMNENQIWIKKTTTGFTGEVRSIGGSCGGGQNCTTPVTVIRFPHGQYPPAVARWMWNPNDEGAWVRCDDGCCKISPN